MNYIQELNAFDTWCSIICPSTSVVALWFAIMQTANQLNWPEEFSVHGSALRSRTGLSDTALSEARNRLIQYGRITYRKGGGNRPGAYSVVPFESKIPGTNPKHCRGQIRNNAETMLKQIRNTAEAIPESPYIPITINETKLNKTNPYSPPMGELFDRFWAVYPKRVGKDPARKAFAKLKPDEALVKTMESALNRQKQSDQWRRDGGQYIPYPATWLNQRRWEDETAEEPEQEQPYRYPTPEDDAPYRRHLTGEETLADLIGDEDAFRGGDTR